MGNHDWRFTSERAGEIAQLWGELSRDKPAMFNGRVLLQSRGDVIGDRFEADYFETDYAAFVAWLRWGAPQPDAAHIRNGFAMGALRSRDGAYLLGVMGGHTYNAGKIYFAAGTPDPSDITGHGEVDLAGSLLRELAEETGLTADEVSVGDDWTLVLSHERCAFLREVRLDLPADEARALIRDRLSRQAVPELSDIAIARSAADIDETRMPPFLQAFLKAAFAA